MAATSSDTATGPSGVATFNISVDGRSVEAGLQVLSITITKELNKIPVSKIVIRDGDAAAKDFTVTVQWTGGGHISLSTTVISPPTMSSGALEQFPTVLVKSWSSQ